MNALKFLAAPLDIYARPGTTGSWRAVISRLGLVATPTAIVTIGDTEPDVDVTLDLASDIVIVNITLTDQQTTDLGGGARDWSFDLQTDDGTIPILAGKYLGTHRAATSGRTETFEISAGTQNITVHITPGLRGAGNPADILAAVLAVDGPGSGLNADLLDGQHAAAFALAANLSTESSARSAADSALDDRLDVLEQDPTTQAAVDDLAASLDPVVVAAASMANQAVKYMLGTYIPSAFPGTAPITSFGGTGETSIRPPAEAASGIASLIAAGRYDPAITGVAEATATAQAVRLATSIAATHLSNGGVWGGQENSPPSTMAGWQQAYWAYAAGSAAWLLWAHLSAGQRTQVTAMVVWEANRMIPLVPPYWKDTGGTEVTPGDTKFEEIAWNAAVVMLALLVVPTHTNRDKWLAKLAEMGLATTAIPADLVDTRPINGLVPATFLQGTNVNANGTIINHNRVHPDYMASACLTSWGALAMYARAGVPVPAVVLRHAELIYGSLSTVDFDPASYLLPGGTMYPKDGDDFVYYPQGNDWGTSRAAATALFDVLARAYSWDTTAARTADYWAQTHLARCIEMQARSTTGQTYITPDEDTYSGRETWVAVHAGLAVLTATSPPVTYDRGLLSPLTYSPRVWYDAHLGGSSTELVDRSTNARAAATFGAGANQPLHLPYVNTPYVWLGAAGTGTNSISCTAPAGVTSYSAVPLGGGAPTTGAATGGAPFAFTTAGSWESISLLNASGTEVARFTAVLCTQTTCVDPYRVTWTINRGTAGRKTVVLSPAAQSDSGIVLFGPDDYISVPAAAMPAMGASDSFTVVLVVRQWGTPTNFGRYLSNKTPNTGTNALGFQMFNNGTTMAQAWGMGDGTTGVFKVGSTYTAGQRSVTAVCVSARTSAIHYRNRDTPGNPTGTLANVGSATSGAQTYLGQNIANGERQDFEFRALLTFDRALTASEVAHLVDYFRGGL